MLKADTMSDDDLSGSPFACMFSRRGALVEKRFVGCLVAKEAPRTRGDGLCTPVHIKIGQRVQNAEQAYGPQLVR